MCEGLDTSSLHPWGKIALLGSGETSASGGQVFEALARELPASPRVRVVETPAGFELNAGQVAGRVADYLRIRLQNYGPNVQQVAVHRKDAGLTAENPGANQPLWDADMIFLGPGSPSYAVRQLQGSLTWEIIQARQRLGAALILASAAAIAAGVLALPVYEIFKVGEDAHWKPGLDLFAPYGLSLVIVSHWNNHDGGADLDTSRCFLGRKRFDPLLSRLTPEMAVVGLDEQTGLIFDLCAQTCKVVGQDQVTVWRGGQESTFSHGAVFPIQVLGDFHLPPIEAGIDPRVWQAAQPRAPETQGLVPPIILDLLQRREEARKQRDWRLSDELRQEIAARGFRVVDTSAGQQLLPVEPIVSD